MHFSKSLQDSKSAVTMHPVSIESTIIPSYIELPRVTKSLFSFAKFAIFQKIAGTQIVKSVIKVIIVFCRKKFIVGI